MHQASHAIVPSQRHRVRNGLRIILASVIVAYIYPLFADDKGDTVAFINAGLIGLIAGAGIAFHQDYLTYGRHTVRFRFIIGVVLTAILYTVGMALIVIMVYTITRSVEAGMGIAEFIRNDGLNPFVSGDFHIIIAWSLVGAIMVSFAFNMSRQVTGNVLANMIFGRYSSPREESRIVMNIDINSATSIAEKLGPVRYCYFLNDFYRVISPSILAARGEVYRYVGDAMTITWKFHKHLDPAWCIRTFFMANNLLNSRVEEFADRYEIVPSFKAALHCGDFIVGEIGDIKCQLVLHGDAMYETQHIEKECSKVHEPFLVSGEFLEHITLPAIYCAIAVDPLRFRGKTIELYAIKEKEAGVAQSLA